MENQAPAFGYWSAGDAAAGKSSPSSGSWRFFYQEMRKNTTNTTKATAASKSEYRAATEKKVRAIAARLGMDPDELVRDVLIDDQEPAELNTKNPPASSGFVWVPFKGKEFDTWSHAYKFSEHWKFGDWARAAMNAAAKDQLMKAGAEPETEPETIAVNLPAAAVRLLRQVAIAAGIAGSEDEIMATVIQDLAADTLDGNGARSLVLEGWSFTPAEAKAADERMMATVARFAAEHAAS